MGFFRTTLRVAGVLCLVAALGSLPAFSRIGLALWVPALLGVVLIALSGWRPEAGLALLVEESGVPVGQLPTPVRRRLRSRARGRPLFQYRQPEWMIGLATLSLVVAATAFLATRGNSHLLAFHGISSVLLSVLLGPAAALLWRRLRAPVAPGLRVDRGLLFAASDTHVLARDLRGLRRVEEVQGRSRALALVFEDEAGPDLVLPLDARPQRERLREVLRRRLGGTAGEAEQQQAALAGAEPGLPYRTSSLPPDQRLDRELVRQLTEVASTTRPAATNLPWCVAAAVIVFAASFSGAVVVDQREALAQCRGLQALPPAHTMEFDPNEVLSARAACLRHHIAVTRVPLLRGRALAELEQALRARFQATSASFDARQLRRLPAESDIPELDEPRRAAIRRLYREGAVQQLRALHLSAIARLKRARAGQPSLRAALVAVLRESLDSGRGLLSDRCTVGVRVEGFVDPPEPGIPLGAVPHFAAAQSPRLLEGLGKVLDRLGAGLVELCPVGAEERHGDRPLLEVRYAMRSTGQRYRRGGGSEPSLGSPVDQGIEIAWKIVLRADRLSSAELSGKVDHELDAGEVHERMARLTFEAVSRSFARGLGLDDAIFRVTPAVPPPS